MSPLAILGILSVPSTGFSRNPECVLTMGPTFPKAQLILSRTQSVETRRDASGREKTVASVDCETALRFLRTDFANEVVCDERQVNWIQKNGQQILFYDRTCTGADGTQAELPYAAHRLEDGTVLKRGISIENSF